MFYQQIKIMFYQCQTQDIFGNATLANELVFVY